jgi:hypothetical protein
MFLRSFLFSAWYLTKGDFFLLFEISGIFLIQSQMQFVAQRKIMKKSNCPVTAMLGGTRVTLTGCTRTDYGQVIKRGLLLQLLCGYTRESLV